MTQTQTYHNKTPTQSGLARLLEELMANSPENQKPAPHQVFEKVLEKISSEPARVWTDPNGFITAINPAFSELCGYSFQEIQGLKPSSFLHGPLTDQNVVQNIRSALATQSPIDVELTNYHKDGSPYRVKISIRPEFVNGELQGFSAEEKKLS